LTIIIVNNNNNNNNNNIPLTEFWGNFMMPIWDKLLSRNSGQPVTSLLNIRTAVEFRSQKQGSVLTAGCHNRTVQQQTCRT
jgi:hypothetical protein